MTHIAAAPVLLETRMVQRCSLCGTKLIDQKRVIGEPLEILPWTAGKFVNNGGPFAVMLPYTDEIPDDLCIDKI